jgi:DNA-binding response OmpR family regulator
MTSNLSSNSNKKRILFVDDEPDLTSLFKMALESGGFYFDVFNNSADVLKNFKPHFYDLVMLDIVMPKMDGFSLYKELQKVDPDVKVCFLTASEKYREGLREGEYQTLSKDLFIQKPLSIKDLRKEIHKRIGLK